MTTDDGSSSSSSSSSSFWNLDFPNDESSISSIDQTWPLAPAPLRSNVRNYSSSIYELYIKVLASNSESESSRYAWSSDVPTIFPPLDDLTAGASEDSLVEELLPLTPENSGDNWLDDEEF